MSRPRCDPFDAGAILKAIEAGETTRLRAYEAYASTAAKPYARSSWEVMLKQYRQPSGIEQTTKVSIPTPAPASMPGGRLYWDRRSNVKPSYVLTTVSDNTRIAVRGASLIITDGDRKLVYEKRGVKPLAIVMTGWSGCITIDAMRFCTDYKISAVILDWDREFMTVVLPAEKQSHSVDPQSSLG